MINISLVSDSFWIITLMNSMVTCCRTILMAGCWQSLCWLFQQAFTTHEMSATANTMLLFMISILFRYSNFFQLSWIPVVTGIDPSSLGWTTNSSASETKPHQDHGVGKRTNWTMMPCAYRIPSPENETYQTYYMPYAAFIPNLCQKRWVTNPPEATSSTERQCGAHWDLQGRHQWPWRAERRAEASSRVQNTPNVEAVRLMHVDEVGEQGRY